jgi:hypothetical protein
MAVTALFVIMTVAGMANGVKVIIRNNKSDTLWVGMKGHANSGRSGHGGFALASGEEVSMELESCGGDMWSAKGWKLHWG